MGRDKAALLLGGETLLARAVQTLRSVPSLQDPAGRVTVTVVGERTLLEGADRAIVDRHAGCGPLGGIEAALGDLALGGEADWAFFVPVDMPFLPPEMIEGLLLEWAAARARGAYVCHAVVDGIPQPLVSLMHKMAHPFVVEALTAGHFKVTPVLESAGAGLASRDANGIGYVLYTTEVVRYQSAPFAIAGPAAEEQEQLRRRWFSNINTASEFAEAETFLARSGSIR